MECSTPILYSLPAHFCPIGWLLVEVYEFFGPVQKTKLFYFALCRIRLPFSTPPTMTTPKPLQKKSPRLLADLSKRTFDFTKICTSFPLVTSCPESAGQSACLRYLTTPIFRFGTRPSTDRAVRALPRRYRDHKRGPRQGRSDIHLDIGAL